ncbi:MAG: hypothetical protein ACUVRV_09500 [Cyanobacteriota bacterium]
MLAHPELVTPGKVNVKAGLLMLLAAIALGLLLNQVQPLLPASDPLTPAYLPGESTAATEAVPAAERSFISWQKVSKQKYAWHICYAFLGNMGLVNIGGGLALLVLGSQLAAGQIFSQILLLGGGCYTLPLGPWWRSLGWKVGVGLAISEHWQLLESYCCYLVTWLGLPTAQRKQFKN